jgi:hypothetical protein
MRGAPRRIFLLLAALLGAAAIGLAPHPAPAAEICGEAETATPGPQDETLRAFARGLGLAHADAFVGTVDRIYRTGRLPSCYLDKREASTHGWHAGVDLSRLLPGDAIGGDRFRNDEHLLPDTYTGHYREADLDEEGGQRGAHRLVYVEDSAGLWLQWVTVDHYRSFHALPRPGGTPP